MNPQPTPIPLPAPDSRTSQQECELQLLRLAAHGRQYPPGFVERFRERWQTATPFINDDPVWRANIIAAQLLVEVPLHEAEPTREVTYESPAALVWFLAFAAMSLGIMTWLVWGLL